MQHFREASRQKESDGSNHGGRKRAPRSKRARQAGKARKKKLGKREGSEQWRYRRGSDRC